MAATLDNLLRRIRVNPESIEFHEVMAVIAENYDYTPAPFTNGVEDDLLCNQAGANEGSCKIFAFAQLHGLNQQETLACFGKYYRQDVLQHPHGGDHLNIRTFLRHGWKGIRFAFTPLGAKHRSPT